MKITKKLIYNTIFYGLVIFILTPYGRPKFIQAFSYVKSVILSPSITKKSERTIIPNLNVNFINLLENENINLKDLNGKVVFINYWATWCAPCIAEMPSIQKLYNDYKNKITFIFITSDPKDKIVDFYKKNNYNLPTYGLGSKPPDEIYSQTLPTTFILDKTTKVTIKEKGALNWNSNKIRKMLDILIQE